MYQESCLIHKLKCKVDEHFCLTRVFLFKMSLEEETAFANLKISDANVSGAKKENINLVSIGHVGIHRIIIR